MASSLEDDLTCPVCLEIYQDPQIVSCGHTFCARCVGHLRTAFSVFYTRTCPMCLQALNQEPVSNLALKNTCESYQREKERKEREEKEKGEEMKCLIHGEKVLFLCVDDGVAICSQCRKLRHMSHKVQPLTHTVPQRKDRIKSALRPAEKVLESLRNGTALECKVTKCIASQAQQAEMQIKEEFEKLHQFLREEEEARRVALREEEEEKKGKLETWIEEELQSISDRLMVVEEDMENDVTFLSNYDQIMTRARGRLSDSTLNSGSLINMGKHVGNLRFRVWEKMKDLCPYYPVVLDPNSSHISVSGDLVSVSYSVRRFYSPNPLQKKSNYLVLGSECQNATLNCWDVEVGDSKHWTLGVCGRSSAERNHMQDLTPQNGFYGLSRKEDFYYVLGSTEARLTLRHPPKTVRVKLTKRLNFNTQTPYWLLSFLDASKNSVLDCIPILSFRSDLCPFLVPVKRNVPLRIVPVNVNMSMEEKFTFFERHTDKMPLYIIIFLVVICMLVVPLARIWEKTDRN